MNSSIRRWLRQFRRQKRGSYPLLKLFAAIQVVFLMVPTLIVLAASFEGGDIVRFPPSSFSLQWYIQILGEERFITGLWRSLLVATFSTTLGIPVGILTALGLIRYEIAFPKYIQIYLLLPFTVPLIVSGVILLIIFGELGWLGRVWPVGLALTIINMPFMIWAVASRVNALDRSLENAAKSLGAEELSTFRYVTLPAILPGVVTGSLIMFVLGLNEFLVSLIITTTNSVTLPVLIYTEIRSNVSPLIAAIASLYVFIAVAVVFLTDKIIGLDELLYSS